MERETSIGSEELIGRILALIEDEEDPVARMANIVAELHDQRDYFWTGWYRVGEGELILGPFQGPTACTRIRKGQGVCGTAWDRNETVVVPDVEEFPGHIACDPRSRSEIVLPVRDGQGEVAAVLDIDSDRKHAFGAEEQDFLETLVRRVEPMALP
ncbi:MAG: GAF domain-containing protein [Flavobacteriales bacterium]